MATAAKTTTKTQAKKTTAKKATAKKTTAKAAPQSRVERAREAAERLETVRESIRQIDLGTSVEFLQGQAAQAVKTGQEAAARVTERVAS